MPLMYWAHSDPSGLPVDDPTAQWQLLSTHLQSVGERAYQLALKAGASTSFAKRARAAGLLHDFGKYTPSFQKLLRGELHKAPHSIFGAALALANAKATDVALAIAGHHAGIPDASELKGEFGNVIHVSKSIWPNALKDLPALATCFEGPSPLLPPYDSQELLTLEVETRMLLSILVDADRLDTAEAAGKSIPPSPRLDAEHLLSRLLSFISQRASACDEGMVRNARAEVLNACLAAADRPGPLFSLTVPTGGGKTFSSMAFALRRAALNPSIRRIIVVIPFLSIIEQNAAAYRAAFGEDIILEHHSSATSSSAEDDYSQPSRRLAYENWDAPIILTTSVRFFESLFSNHPRDVRRLASLANSIIILDEVQSLPRAYVSPTLSILKTLVDHWGANIVFCTATQPALESSPPASPNDPRLAPGSLDEIIPDPPQLFHILRRVSTEWRTDPLSWSQLASEVATQPQALVIVNTRKAASSLFAELQSRSATAFHLSNNMCPAHRLARLRQVRHLLAEGLPCQLVATQLVEAGVDIDFPIVWRAVAPLDSIAQAAGRCDREGRLTAALGRPGGRFIVFQPEDDSTPPKSYKEGASITATMIAAGDTSWSEPATIRRYFDQFYRHGNALDLHEIQNLRGKFKFRTVAEKVSWIDENSTPVLVPYDQSAVELIRSIPFSGLGLAQLRQSQPYIVSLADNQLRKARNLGSIYALIDGTDFYALHEGLYSDTLGIQFEGMDAVI